MELNYALIATVTHLMKHDAFLLFQTVQDANGANH
jgi:hypothetical protein